jgi:hypothetical protein
VKASSAAVSPSVATRPRAPTLSRSPAPTIASVDVSRSTSGVGDVFVATIVATVAKGADPIAARFYRSESSEPKRDVKTIQGAFASTLVRSTSRKGVDGLSLEARRLSNMGVSTPVFSASIDNATGLRTVPAQSMDFPNVLGKALCSPLFDVSAVGPIDKDVAQDLNVVKNITDAVASSRFRVINERAVVGVGFVETDDVSVTHAATLDKRSSLASVVEAGNFDEFKLVGTTPAKQRVRAQDGSYVFSFVDPTVTYGRSYRYFVESVSADGTVSARSRIVDVAVPPVEVISAPTASTRSTSMSVLLSIVSTDGHTSKFEVYRRGQSAGRANVRVIGDSFPSDSTTFDLLSSGFALVGEVVCSGGGGTFVDYDVLPGKTYEYRVYADNAFGTKSSGFAEASVRVGKTRAGDQLKPPTVESSYDPLAQAVNVRISNNEPGASVILERRDCSIGQRSFGSPSSVDDVIIGIRDAVSLLSSPTLFSRDGSWSGVFPALSGTFVHVDKSTQFDRTYQYRAHCVDRFGNRSGYTQTQPLMLSSWPKIDRPVSLDVRSTVAGETRRIDLSWADGNVDVSPSERFGSRAALDDSSVRTLYQIERADVTDGVWRSFALVEGTSSVDDGTFVERPRSMPDAPKLGATYRYRVAAVQTGSYYSDFCEPVQVVFKPAPTAPKSLKTQTPDVATKPFYVSVSWATPDESELIDKWEVERAGVNNLAAGKLGLNDVSSVSKLEFTRVATVSKESSRLSSFTSDRQSRESSAKLLGGDRGTVDDGVESGNTYFYRVRAVSSDGALSEWSYRAVRLSSERSEKALAASSSKRLSDLSSDKRTVTARSSR